MRTLTLDTCVWIKLIDGADEADAVGRLLDLHSQEAVEVVVSNRLYEHDTSKMDLAQITQLKSIFEERQIKIQGSGFRNCFSLLSGGDLLSGGPTIRTPAEMHKFNAIVGKDPIITHPQGPKLSNKFGDYDSLKDHYAVGRDVFITYDTKHYLSERFRDRYRSELGLIIMSPEHFLHSQ